jgi:hypothetical protein
VPPACIDQRLPTATQAEARTDERAAGRHPSYQGWSVHHLVEAALVGGDPGVIAWVERFTRLKAYTTVLEPDGESYVGPSHFSPATCAPAALDQGEYIYTRDTAVAGLLDEGRYLGVGGRDGWPALPTPDQMREEITARIDEATGFAAGEVQGIPQWQERHYPGSEEPGFRRYQPGTYATLRDLVDARSGTAPDSGRDLATSSRLKSGTTQTQTGSSGGVLTTILSTTRAGATPPADDLRTSAAYREAGTTASRVGREPARSRTG